MYIAENQIEDDHMDIPESLDPTNIPRPQQDQGVPGHLCSMTVEDNDAYAPVSLYTSASEFALGIWIQPPNVFVPTQTGILSCQLLTQFLSFQLG